MSHSIGEDSQSLFVEAVPGKSLTVLCGEKRIWGINLEDIRCIRSVHVCLSDIPTLDSFDDLF